MSQPDDAPIKVSITQLDEIIQDVADKWAVTMDEKMATMERLYAYVADQKEALRRELLADMPEPDKHSHITRIYCLDCAQRDGFNNAQRLFAEAINKVFGEKK